MAHQPVDPPEQMSLHPLHISGPSIDRLDLTFFADGCKSAVSHSTRRLTYRHTRPRGKVPQRCTQADGRYRLGTRPDVRRGAPAERVGRFCAIQHGALPFPGPLTLRPCGSLNSSRASVHMISPSPERHLACTGQAMSFAGCTYSITGWRGRRVRTGVQAMKGAATSLSFLVSSQRYLR